jgi:predicted HNH restriction endonuclease
MTTKEITQEIRQEVLKSLDVLELYQEIQDRNNISDEAKAAAEKAKAEGLVTMFIVIAGTQYVYRPINRKEWREHLKTQNKAIAEAGEDKVKIFEVQEDAKEALVEAALVYNESSVVPAGAIDILSDVILIESGFGPPETEPIRL